jgi:hypothetical protein
MASRPACQLLAGRRAPDAPGMWRTATRLGRFRHTAGGVPDVTDAGRRHQAGRHCLYRILPACLSLMIVPVSSAELRVIRNSVHYRTGIWLTRLASTLVVPVIVLGPLAGLSALAIVAGVLASTAMAVAYMMLLQAGVPLTAVLMSPTDPKLWHQFFRDVAWFRRPGSSRDD